jgi:3-deoxy-D-manno-octulosonic-acid transferase
MTCDGAVRALRSHLRLGDAPVLVAAPTCAGEEEMILDAFARLRPDFALLRLLLAPRDPERCAGVAQLAAARGHRVARRSGPVPAAVDVIVGDDPDERAAYYALGRVALIGGTLVAAGGHDPVEAAAAGVPMLIGPHEGDFAAAIARFRGAGVLTRVDSTDALVAAVAGRLLDAAVSVWEIGTALRVLRER